MNNKKKILIIFIVAILFSLITLTIVFVVKKPIKYTKDGKEVILAQGDYSNESEIDKSVKYTEDGKAIIWAGEDYSNEVEVGTPVTLAVPLNTPSKAKTDEEVAKEKQKYIDKAEELNSKGTTKAQEDDEETNYDSEYNENSKKFNSIIEKYYGKEYLEEMLEENEKNNSEMNSITETYSEKDLKYLKDVINLIDSPKLNEEEKLVLKKGIKTSFVESIPDEYIKERIKGFNEEL